MSAGLCPVDLLAYLGKAYPDFPIFLELPISNV